MADGPYSGILETWGKILKSVLEPIERWVLAWSWGARLLLVVVVATLSVAIANFATVRALLPIAHGYVLQLTHRPSLEPALEAEDIIALESMRANLRSALQVELKQSINGPQSSEDPLSNPARSDPWAVAQIVSALGQVSTTERGQLLELFTKASVGNCGWRQGSGEKIPLLGGAGWVLVAYATLGVPLTRAQYKCLLDLQNAEGWWPPSALATQQRANASTYATIWMTLGLNANIEHKLVPSDLTQDAQLAVDRSYEWLGRQRLALTASSRWTDYPNDGPGGKVFGSSSEQQPLKMQKSISALVVHCLQRVRPGNYERIEHDWMGAFPRALPMPTESGKSARWFNLTIADPASLEDITSHYVLPWTLMALVDSYHAGSVSAQVTAEQSLHEFLNRGDAVTSDALQHSWVSAELLASLNYLNTKLGVNTAHPQSGLAY